MPTHISTLPTAEALSAVSKVNAGNLPLLERHTTSLKHTDH
jgi:hypothetical protein